MGREAEARIAPRLMRTIFGLGGNHVMIVAPSADLELAACDQYH
jgi:acyl-CoA reductase-like NAD-dependent aldehyde dehydrogenase